MHVNSSLLFYQFIGNIQEIIDIEWLYERISMFYLSFTGKKDITVKQE